MRYTKSAAALLGAAAMVCTSLAVASPASAQATSGLSDTVRIVSNYDTGSKGNPWASLAFEREVLILKDTPRRPRVTPSASPSTTPSPTPTTWTVKLTDRGTFKTLKGKKSPGAGVPIESAANGTFTGTFFYTVTSATPPSERGVRRAYDYRCNMNGTGNRAVDCPGMPKSTSEWPKLYFDANATVTPGKWEWSYRTSERPRESWTNGSTGNVGDIVGKKPLKKVRSERPILTKPSCDWRGRVKTGRLSVPWQREVDFKINGRDVRDGLTIPVRRGTYRVDAVAEEGYELRGRTTWEWDVREPRCRSRR